MSTNTPPFHSFLRDKGLSQDAEPRFARFLLRNNLTPYQLHKLTGISKALCFDYAKGKVLPSQKTVQKIAHALKMPSFALLEQLDTRERSENRPKAGAFARKSLQNEGDDSSKCGPSRISSTTCGFCGQPIAKPA